MELKIQTTKLLDPSLIELAAARAMSVPSCAAQIIEAAIVEFRSLRIRPSLVGFSNDESLPIKKPQRYVPLTEDEIEEAWRLIRKENLTVAEATKGLASPPRACAPY